MSAVVNNEDSLLVKSVPHGVDMYKEDLDGPLWWLQDNDYLYRGYRTQLTFWETFKRYYYIAVVISSAFRCTNETMNIWTHYVGASLFIFLIYLTYAIPVENLFTIRKDVVLANKAVQCTSMNYTDLVNDHSHVNSSCVNALSRDESIAEEFSSLLFYLSSTGEPETMKNLTETSSSFFSWYNNNSIYSFPAEAVSAVMNSLRSLYSSLLSWLQSNPDSSAALYARKSADIAEVLESDLTEMNHQVVGHIPRWPIIVFLGCAIWCLGGSAIYHQYYCTSFIVSNVLQTIDYCGICILISGSYVPIIYYAFYCYPKALWIHLSIVIFINVCNVCVMATPKFRYLSVSSFISRQPEYRPIRARSFTLVACYAFIALGHLYILDGLNNPLFTISFWYILGMGATYILGAFLYGSRIPEKYFPGYFDYVVGNIIYISF